MRSAVLLFFGTIGAMTDEQRRSEILTLLAAMLHNQNPQSLATAKNIDDLLNTVTAVHTEMEAFLSRGTK